jgi:predicted metal-dependent hydrolase
MIPTLPVRVRDRLARTILAALHDETARRTLGELGSGALPLDDWLEPGQRPQAPLLVRRARQAAQALRDVPVGGGEPPLRTALGQAAVLFDAGLGFEVHELLEPFWVRAVGAERAALQGLIQVAVGYQHLANGNLDGARALLEEGSGRLAGQRLAGLDLDVFASAVLRSVARVAVLGSEEIPRFPRAISAVTCDRPT